MRQKNKKILACIILAVCMLILGACGKSEEKAADEIYSHLDIEEQANVDEDREEITNYEAANKAEAESDEAKETDDDENISEDEGVPWDDMSPVNIKDFPAGIRGSVDENTVFFPNILFPSEYIIADEICRARLNNKDYNAYAYVETHSRTIEDGGGLYFERVGDFIIYTEDIVKNIEIKNTTHDYLIHISVEIWLADEDFMNEYLIKNCEYIKEQIEEMLSNENILTEETASEESVQGETPYGVYECESDAMAYVESWHNEIDVIDIFLNDDELMTDFEWVEGKTYNLIMPNAESPLATATFDESGNMQITALSDEAKPYEGYYISVLN